MPKTTVLQDSKRKCSVFQLVQQLPNTSNRSAFFITSYYLQLLCGNYLQLLCGNYLQLLCGNYLQLLCGKLLRELLSTQDFQLNQPQLNQQPLLPTVHRMERSRPTICLNISKAGRPAIKKPDVY